MDRRFFKLIDKATECVQLANSLAHNADYKQEYDDIMQQHLPGLLQMMSQAQQTLFKAVRRQCAGEPWDERLDLNK